MAIFSLIFPVSASLVNPIVDLPSANSAKSPSVVIDPEITSQSESGSAQASSIDCTVTVDVLDSGAVKQIPLDQYLIGVTAAEMPASFELEALKAQATAARTYTLYRMLITPSPAHPEADVCTDSSCCKAYSSQEALKEKFGDSYDTYISKITEAVTSTDGQYIKYDGEPILAAFHSSSDTVTEECGNIWGASLPYLVSVESPEKDDDIPSFTSTVEVSFSDFSDTIAAEYPDADVSGDYDSWISDIKQNNTGRLDCVCIGGVAVSGTKLRSMFELRSAAIDIQVTDEGIIFTTTGYGHGVGMSQYGANHYAKTGKNYTEILSHYYQNTEISTLSELF